MYMCMYIYTHMYMFIHLWACLFMYLFNMHLFVCLFVCSCFLSCVFQFVWYLRAPTSYLLTHAHVILFTLILVLVTLIDLSGTTSPGRRIPDSNLGPQNIPGFNETKTKCLLGPTSTHSQKGIRMKLGDGHSFHTPKKYYGNILYIYIFNYLLFFF